MRRRRDICSSIWSSTPSLARFLWPCSHRMLQCLCPHHCLTRFCLNQRRRGWLPSNVSHPPSLLVRPLMPRRFQNHNVPSFTAICGRWNSATQSSVAEKEGIPRSTLSRLVSRTRERGQIGCRPHGSYRRATSLHPAFTECIRRLFGLPTRLTMTAIREHTEMQQVAARLSKETGT